MPKLVPFTDEQITAIATDYPTPFYLYDEIGIRESATRFNDAFARFPGFKEFFAVKATPNPAILQILREQGFGADCSSLAELVLARRTGFAGEEMMFTSNVTTAAEFQEARQLGAIINLDDIGHIDYLERHAGLPDLVSLRYNPGPLRGGNRIIGAPAESKFGMTRDQVFAGYERLRSTGVRRFGLHTMIASNELDQSYIVDTTRMLFDMAVDIADRLDIRLEFVNIGGGIGIPYHPDQQPVDLAGLAEQIGGVYAATITANELDPLRLFTECGRVITGPHGYLVARVLHVKQTYKRYVGLDATMADLMRPGMYGAYHHLSVVGKDGEGPEVVCDVTGSLCENNDKFAVDRPLPPLEPGDLVVIHDVGAHGRAMGFNYNGKLRPAELLLRADGTVEQIRRRETLDDYFATLQALP